MVEFSRAQASPEPPAHALSLTKSIAAATVAATFLWLLSFMLMRIGAALRNAACYSGDELSVTYTPEGCEITGEWLDASLFWWLFTPLAWGVLGLLVKAVPARLILARITILWILVALPLVNTVSALIGGQQYWSLFEWSTLLTAIPRP
ncbi:hypothetical protein [Streptosporangium roseum]|uniref:hypothetical protein n=1 Tax=Streptosporangium roseum TaxID=2001 RepID=UPI0031EBEC05